MRAIAQNSGRSVEPRRGPPAREEILIAGPYPGILPYPSNGPVRNNPRRASNRVARTLARRNPAIAGRHLSGFSGKPVVERRRYEAMIYELGKLQVWQEICKQERRGKEDP